MLHTESTINETSAPRIFRNVFEKRITSRRPWVTIGLSHKSLQSMLSGRIKTVHRLVLHQLGANRLNVSPNGGLFSKASRVADSRNRETEQDHNDADHDHDLKQRKSGLVRSFSHFLI